MNHKISTDVGGYTCACGAIFMVPSDATTDEAARIATKAQHHADASNLVPEDDEAEREKTVSEIVIQMWKDNQDPNFIVATTLARIADELVRMNDQLQSVQGLLSSIEGRLDNIDGSIANIYR